MWRPFVCAGCVLAVCAGGLPAFEVSAVIKKVHAEKGVVVFTAGEQERTVRVPKDARILDEEGKALAGGLKAKELKVGAAVTLTVERVDGKPLLKAIRLSKKGAKPAEGNEFKKVDTSGLKPLTDLGKEEYKGFPGGLYPDGKNERPEKHEAAGVARSKQVQPLDATGKPDANGKIVLLAVGFSNTVQSFNGFMQVAKDDRSINPRVLLVNGAVGGMSANMVQDPDKGRGAKYWATVDERLKSAGATRAQVQVIWIKETNPGPHVGGFPKYIQTLQSEIARIVQILPGRFPNVKLVYLSSRTYGGWAKPLPGRSAPGNSEPYSYETGFAVKWLIEQQLKGEAALNFDPDRGAVKAPWLSWGPYLWANGENKRKDGFHFHPDDFRANDRMHHSEQGQKKIGGAVVRFFKSDSTTKGWFLAKGE